MAIRSAVIFNIVEESVGDFEDGLVGDVLVGPGACRVSGESWEEVGLALNPLDPKLDAPEALGQLVDKLLLDGVFGRVGHGVATAAGDWQFVVARCSSRTIRADALRSRWVTNSGSPEGQSPLLAIAARQTRPT